MGYMTVQRMQSEFLDATGLIYKRKIIPHENKQSLVVFNSALFLYLYSILPLVNFLYYLTRLVIIYISLPRRPAI